MAEIEDLFKCIWSVMIISQDERSQNSNPMVMKFLHCFDWRNFKVCLFSHQRKVFLNEGLESHEERHAPTFGGQFEQLLIKLSGAWLAHLN